MSGAGIYQTYIKRALDIVISSSALVILSPVIVLVTIMLWAAYAGRSPVFV